MSLPFGDPRHGSTNGYSNHHCHCRECRAEWARWCAEKKRDRAERLAKDPTLAEHGRVSTYSNWLCRCEPCTEANRLDKAERRARNRRRAAA